MNERAEGYWWVTVLGRTPRPLWLCTRDVDELWTTDPDDETAWPVPECVGGVGLVVEWGPYLGREPGGDDNRLLEAKWQGWHEAINAMLDEVGKRGDDPAAVLHVLNHASPSSLNLQGSDTSGGASPKEAWMAATVAKVREAARDVAVESILRDGPLSDDEFRRRVRDRLGLPVAIPPEDMYKGPTIVGAVDLGVGETVTVYERWHLGPDGKPDRHEMSTDDCETWTPTTPPSAPVGSQGSTEKPDGFKHHICGPFCRRGHHYPSNEGNPAGWDKFRRDVDGLGDEELELLGLARTEDQ